MSILETEAVAPTADPSAAPPGPGDRGGADPVGDTVVDGAGTDTEDFVTFVVEHESFAFPMALVREIIRLPRVVHVPLGPPSLVGLANLRGRVLPILDLRSAAGFPAREADDRTRVIVVDLGTAVGLVVDRVASVTSVRADRVDAAVGVKATVRSELLAGVIRSGDDQIVSVLDVRRLLEGEFAAAVRDDADDPSWDTSLETADAAHDRDHDDDATLELVSFVVAGEEYALPVERVQEIVQAPSAVTEVPNAASHVLGVMDLRGRLLPVVSMRRIFGLADQPLEPNNRIVVVPMGGADGAGSAVVGVVMDTVRQVLRVPRSLVHPLPAFIAREGERTEVESVCRMDDGRRLVSVLAADRLFDLDAIAALADTAADDTDATATAVAGTPTTSEEAGVDADREDDQLVVFRLASEEFAVPVDAVQEIIRVPERLIQVPKTLEHVEGLVNLRGTVLPVIDLRTRLGLPRAERDDRQRIVVLSIGGVRTGFVVDAVAEVLKLTDTVPEPAPALTPAQAELIGQVANMPERRRMLLIVEPSRLLATTDAGAVPAGTDAPADGPIAA